MYWVIKLDQQSYCAKNFTQDTYSTSEDSVKRNSYVLYIFFVAFDGCKPRHNNLNVTRLTLIHRDRSNHCYISKEDNIFTALYQFSETSSLVGWVTRMLCINHSTSWFSKLGCIHLKIQIWLWYSLVKDDFSIYLSTLSLVT